MTRSHFLWSLGAVPLLALTVAKRYRPQAPVLLTSKGGHLTWRRPGYPGTSPITGYNVYVDGVLQ